MHTLRCARTFGSRNEAKLKRHEAHCEHTINSKLTCVFCKMSTYWNLYTCRDGVWAIDGLASQDYQMALDYACRLLERGPHGLHNVLMTHGILKTPYDDAILISRVRDESRVLIMGDVHVCNDSSLYVKCKDDEELKYYESSLILSPGLLMRLELEGESGTIKLIGPAA